MKASIITLHRVFNYGSILQAYATQKIFENKGYNTEIIDYITLQRTNKRLFGMGGKKNLKNKYIYLFFKFFSIIFKKITFGYFLKKYMNLSKNKYISANDLSKNPPKSDLYITGSDQVWNSKYNEGVDKGFFLDFAPNCCKKIAFVSSFGKTELLNEEKQITKNYLSKYSAISVREDTAVNIISDLGFQSVCLVDPTLQLRREEWLNLASKRLIKENYLILMLLYNEDNGATEYARKIADAKGLKLVKLSWEMYKPHLVDKLMTHRPPQDFLSLFYYADFVVTNSFHGLAFSINFNKQFIVVPRNEFNSRIESLLRLTSLSNRMVDNINLAINTSDTIIDYRYVNSVLERERKKANDFINSLEV